MRRRTEDDLAERFEIVGCLSGGRVAHVVDFQERTNGFTYRSHGRWPPQTSTVLAGQSPPPVRGTMALEGTTDKVYTALNVIIVKT